MAPGTGAGLGAAAACRRFRSVDGDASCSSITSPSAAPNTSIARPGTARAGLDQPVDAGIVAHRIVVGEREPPQRRPAIALSTANSIGLCPQPNACRVLAERELRVVDQQVGAGDERGVAASSSALGGAPPPAPRSGACGSWSVA